MIKYPGWKGVRAKGEQDSSQGTDMNGRIVVDQLSSKLGGYPYGLCMRAEYMVGSIVSDRGLESTRPTHTLQAY